MRTVMIRVTPDDSFTPDRIVEGSEVGFCLRQVADSLTKNKWYDAGYSFPIYYQMKEVGYCCVYDTPMLFISAANAARSTDIEGTLQAAMELLEQLTTNWLPDNIEALTEYEVEMLDELQKLRDKCRELGLPDASL